MLAKLAQLKIKVDWRLLVSLAVVLWLINAIVDVFVDGGDLDPMTLTYLNVAARLTFYGYAGLLLVVGGLLLLVGLRAFASSYAGIVSVEDERAPVRVDKAEVIDPGVSATLDRLQAHLAVVEENKGRALAQLRDAEQLAGTLVGLVRRAVAKKTAQENEIATLRAALDALSGGDPLQVAAAAGALDDQHIRELMLAPSGDAEFRAGLAGLISSEVGALSQSTRALRELSGAWVERLAAFRAQTTRIAVAVDALDAVPCLAGINIRLELAQGALSDMPDIRTLPSISAAAGPAVRMIEGYR